MSFFVRAAVTMTDLKVAIEQIAEALAERFRGHDAEIAELRAGIERLKAEPRKSFGAKLRARGRA